jgi:hypothetical protein
MKHNRALITVELLLLARVAVCAAASAAPAHSGGDVGARLHRRSLQGWGDLGLGKLRTVPVEKTEFVKATEYVTRDAVKQEVHYRPALTTGTLVVKVCVGALLSRFTVLLPPSCLE